MLPFLVLREETKVRLDVLPETLAEAVGAESVLDFIPGLFIKVLHRFTFTKNFFFSSYLTTVVELLLQMAFDIVAVSPVVALRN